MKGIQHRPDHAIGASITAPRDDSADAHAGSAGCADSEVIAVTANDTGPAHFRPRRFGWQTLATCVALPVLLVALAIGAGLLKWQNTTAHTNQVAATESVRAAADATVALLSYRPETVERDLDGARGRLTGQFLDSYTSLTRDVVIPGAQQKQIAAEASIPAAASISASRNHAVVLLFVNQTVTVGKDAPTSTSSSVRVALDKVDDRWLIAQFDPV